MARNESTNMKIETLQQTNSDLMKQIESYVVEIEDYQQSN